MKNVQVITTHSFDNEEDIPGWVFSVVTAAIKEHNQRKTPDLIVTFDYVKEDEVLLLVLCNRDLIPVTGVTVFHRIQDCVVSNIPDLMKRLRFETRPDCTFKDVNKLLLSGCLNVVREQIYIGKIAVVNTVTTGQLTTEDA